MEARWRIASAQCCAVVVLFPSAGMIVEPACVVTIVIDVAVVVALVILVVITHFVVLEISCLIIMVDPHLIHHGI